MAAAILQVAVTAAGKPEASPGLSHRLPGVPRLRRARGGGRGPGLTPTPINTLSVLKPQQNKKTRVNREKQQIPLFREIRHFIPFCFPVIS